VQVPISIPLKLCLYSEIFGIKELRDLETGVGSFKVIENGAVRISWTSNGYPSLGAGTPDK